MSSEPRRRKHDELRAVLTAAVERNRRILEEEARRRERLRRLTFGLLGR